MTEAMKRRLFGLCALGIAGSALAWVSLGDLGDDLVYYWSPTELLAHQNATNATVRLGGLVQEGSLNWDAQAQEVAFHITDGEGTVPVHCTANPPQMFREGIGVVVEGQLHSDGIFHTERIMVKHSNEYRAPGDGIDPKSVYKSLVVEEG